MASPFVGLGLALERRCPQPRYKAWIQKYVLSLLSGNMVSLNMTWSLKQALQLYWSTYTVLTFPCDKTTVVGIQERRHALYFHSYDGDNRTQPMTANRNKASR